MANVFKQFNEQKWNELRTHAYFAEYREQVMNAVDRYSKTDPPYVKFTDIHRFEVDGDREGFENVYNDYFDRLNAFFAAYMLTRNEEYLPTIANLVWSICDFESWSIPAHVEEHRSISERRQNLDLCSTIAGARIAQIVYFLGDKLPGLVVKRARAEVRYRIIESYKTANRERYWWVDAVNNWPAVCIASILEAYMYMADKEEIDEQLPKMIRSIDGYISGFSDDGCCSEGYAYWVYGFSYFCVFATLLREYTDGEIDYFKNPKVEKIARFQEYILLNEKEGVSFSDSTISFVCDTPMTHLLKSIYPDLNTPKTKAEANPAVALYNILWQNPELGASSIDLSKPMSFKFEDTQWFIYRSSAYSFTCKAGHNDEMHNHNDVGSFMVSKGRGVTFCDPGKGRYSKDYFAPETRYGLALCSSRGHSVPIINGAYQSTLANKSKIYVNEENRYAFSMEGVYEVDTLKSLTRDFTCAEDGIVLTDTYEFTEAPVCLVERFVSLYPMSVSGESIVCEESEMLFDKDLFDVSFSSEEVDRRGGMTDTVYYADLTVKNPDRNMSFTFKFI